MVSLISCTSDDEERDTLTLIYWQAPSLANPYIAVGDKDTDASALVLEPLANYNENGVLVPRLAKSIPTEENGGIVHMPNMTGTMVTWELKEGILWSDGTPLTADDVIFTYGYSCAVKEGGCPSIQGVTASQDNPMAVTITYTDFVPYPYSLFVGASSPILQKAQFESCLGDIDMAKQCVTENLYPAGTGPYVITEFVMTEGAELTSTIHYETNSHFRAPEKLFDSVVIEGGGDAESAARAVLETEQADFAWNLQITPQTLQSLEAMGKGSVRTAFAASVERLMLNFTNPDPGLGDDQSEYRDGTNPHPFLSELEVRKALSLAIDRSAISGQLYGAAGKATCNLIPSPPHYASTSNDSCLTQDIEGAKQLLEDAGWVAGTDGVREKNGVRLEILYQTSTNAVRQSTQEMIKGWWEQIGVQTTLEDIDAGTFFGPNRNIYRFFSDVQMYTDLAEVDPHVHLGTFVRGNENYSNIPSSLNNWTGTNISRWYDSSLDYENLFETLQQTPAGPARENLIIRLNDIIVQNYVVIPLVDRAIVTAVANSIEGFKENNWDSNMWNIHEWSRR